jgi:hypothetical protein
LLQRIHRLGAASTRRHPEPGGKSIAGRLLYDEDETAVMLIGLQEPGDNLTSNALLGIDPIDAAASQELRKI